MSPINKTAPISRNARALKPRWVAIVLTGFLCALSMVPLLGASQVATPQNGFVAENAELTRSMMTAMSGPSTGDPDRDFASMMIAHHEGAIAMARVELRYGRNAALRTMAQHIVDTQGQEIEAMRRDIAQ